VTERKKEKKKRLGKKKRKGEKGRGVNERHCALPTTLLPSLGPQVPPLPARDGERKKKEKKKKKKRPTYQEGKRRGRSGESRPGRHSLSLLLKPPTGTGTTERGGGKRIPEERKRKREGPRLYGPMPLLFIHPLTALLFSGGKEGGEKKRGKKVFHSKKGGEEEGERWFG